MSLRHKKNSVNRTALLVVGLVFFAVLAAYIFVRIDATRNRPRELPFERIGAAREIAPVESEIPEIGSDEAEFFIPEKIVAENPSDAENWRTAENTLVKYFENINAENYDAAIALRTPEYLVGTPAAYSAQLASSMQNDISGKLKITEIERLPNASKSTTKYFRFRKDVIWSFDGSTHSEIRKAALVLRDGKWTIDFFEVERKF